MNKQTNSSSSIIASDSFLEDVARRCIERELMTRHADMLNASNEANINNYGCNLIAFDYWNISDRH